MATKDEVNTSVGGKDSGGGEGSNKKKRGPKPRSQRKRKRPTLSSNANLVFETEICRLELDGRPVNVSNPWIRVVKPYPFTFATFAKARWNSRTVLDVYSTEFGSYHKSYYEAAIEQGRILVSDEKVDLNYKIKGGDLLSHTVHRHEPAVAVSSQDGIDVLEETADLVVVDKPGTLPVHPCGGYHMNSLSHILEPQFGKLYNINRLDRLTSGLVLLAKSSAIAQQLGKCLMQRDDSCQKIYLARVKGKFPLNCSLNLNESVRSDEKLPCRHGEWIVDDDKEIATDVGARGSAKSLPKTSEEMKRTNALGAWIAETNGRVERNVTLQQLFEAQHPVDSTLNELRQSEKSEADSSRCTESRNNILWLQLACPTRVAKPKDGICEAGSFADLETSVYEKTVKPAQTAFSVVSYDEGTDSTVVLCRPMTGRTHQIRLHLQFLGHPIANDPCYGGDMFFGDEEGHDAFTIARTQLDALNEANLAVVETVTGATNDNATEGPILPATITDTPATQAELNALAHLKRNDDEPLHDFIKRTCVWCARSRGQGEGNNERTMLEFLCRSRGVFLHALAYRMVDENGRQFKFRTKVPSWASP